MKKVAVKLTKSRPPLNAGEVGGFTERTAREIVKGQGGYYVTAVMSPEGKKSWVPESAADELKAEEEEKTAPDPKDKKQRGRGGR